MIKLEIEISDNFRQKMVYRLGFFEVNMNLPNS